MIKIDIWDRDNVNEFGILEDISAATPTVKD